MHERKTIEIENGAVRSLTMLVEYAAEKLRMRDRSCAFGVQEKGRTQRSMGTGNLGLVARNCRLNSTEVGDDAGDRILTETSQISTDGHVEVALSGGSDGGASGGVHILPGFAAFGQGEDIRVH